ncbi:Gldg family protein [Verrucomicrobiaceae bacterium N1E253]|uniref:Gldg family protein n=1 Tax=Oceaniferula marina TaxID=2748318 RepID=A0A851GIU4_9BACT|nr:Gldg family protein [Oceaniferula marina]NWK57099.1 Gldg family protein [Oceaniferula marina]
MPKANKESSSSSSKKTKTSRPTRPIRRAGQSLTVIIQLVLILIAVGAANYLSCARHKRIDLTENETFTLSDHTDKLITGSAIQKRTSPIRVIAVIRRSSPHYSRMYNLLDAYKGTAGKSIDLEFVDPARQTDRTLEIANTYKQPYIDDMIIIDGRPQTKTTPETTPETTNSNAGPSDNFAAHIRTIKVKDLYIEEVDQFKQRYIAAWQDEDIVSSAILGAIEGNPRRMYFATDKSNLEATDGAPAWQILANMLWQQNILLTPLRLADIQRIPDDAEGFALIAPQYDLDERELEILNEYWDRPQSSLLVTLDPNIKLNNLRIFLRNYGITPRNDRIIQVKNKQTLSNVRAIFTRGPKINIDLGGKSTVFDGSTCSLEVRENDDQLTNRRITPISLIQATEGWWGETRYTEESPQFNKEEDNEAPLYLSAAVIRGQATSDATINLVSKMVVIANTDFLAKKNTRPEQADFVKSSTNWLIGREELIGIGPRKLYRHKITLLNSHNTFINRLLLIFLPALAILISLVVWNMRRA